jgi:predicted transglutaminase-like cysteine proteinase
MQFASIILATTIALGLVPTELRAAETPSGSTRSEPDFAMFPGWQRVVAQVAKDAVTVPQPVVSTNATMCKPGAMGSASGDCEVARWDAFIEQSRKLPKDQQLEAVNKWVNAHAYVEDWANWGLPDYWETPREFLTRGGDCEDFAITKYFSLVRLGFSPADLKIVVVKDVKLQMFHAVLSVQRLDSPTVLLDNQNVQIVPMAVATNYRPIYSLNGYGWSMETQPQFASNNLASTVRIVTAAGH